MGRNRELGMTRLRIDLGYDGTDFHGWAIQSDAGLRTVQGELQLWISRVLRAPGLPSLVVAGRTDAGVHARRQVAHLDIPDDWDAGTTAATLQRRLRAALPDDIAVNRVTVAPPGFDARFSAIWRRYVYRLTDGVPDPLLRRWVVGLKGTLDLDALNAAARQLVGLHDFVAFCKAREGATTIRDLLDVRAERTPTCVELTVRADAFCHSMVRSLTGALVDVATGRRDAAWLRGLLDRTRRSGEVRVMPAKGLTLEEVGYPDNAELAARALQARAVRSLDCCPDDAEPNAGTPQTPAVHVSDRRPGETYTSPDTDRKGDVSP
jgi:tRNA pseudouridine38-40 synthase